MHLKKCKFPTTFNPDLFIQEKQRKMKNKEWKGVLNKDPTVWLDGARPPPRVLVNNFKLNINQSYENVKHCPPPPQKNAKC